MPPLSFLKAVNILGFVLVIVVNALANVIPLGGNTTAEVSEASPTLITPAGYVFSIWGVIYALLLVFTFYQAYVAREAPFLSKISVLFLLSSLVNVFWLFLWHYEQIVPSVVLMFLLLANLIAIYLRLQIGKSKVSLNERLCVHLPFSVYLGWISIAAIANVASALVAVNWDGWGIPPVTWASLLIAIALVVTLAVIATRKDVAYSLVILWALGGIIVDQAAYQSIVQTAEVSAVIVVVALAVVYLLSFRAKKQ
jgi:hypothetical protein